MCLCRFGFEWITTFYFFPCQVCVLCPLFDNLCASLYVLMHRSWRTYGIAMSGTVLNASLIYLSVCPHQSHAYMLSRTESATSRIQRIPSPSPPKAASRLKYSHMVESTLWPRDPGKLSPDLSRVRSRDISTTLGSHDIQTCDPGKVSHDLPRDWSSTQSQVTTWSPDRMHFRCAPSPLIGIWKTVGTINGSTSQQASHKTWKRSKVAHPSPVFVPALKYGSPV